MLGIHVLKAAAKLITEVVKAGKNKKKLNDLKL